MIRLYYCFSSLGNRDYTCENMLKAALHVDPRRPETYFLLSQFYERKNNWMDSYMYASVGLDVAEKSPSSLVFGSSYEGEYALLFQKAVSAWWYGKPDESRSIFRILKEKYRSIMSEAYVKLVQNNLSRLGSGREADSCVRYNKEKYEYFRFKFEGMENITRNHSQVCQDLFVLAMLNGKRNGTYLEVGAAHAYHNSNTALLEEFGWAGVGIEINEDLAKQHESRKNKVICSDALSLNYEKLLSENFEDNKIDYLQLDIEPSKNTFEALLLIPLDKYQFRVITYEHDHYVDMTGSYREKSRKYLSSMGYSLVVGDISPNANSSFEDWWVKEELVDQDMLKKFADTTKNDTNFVGEIMFGPVEQDI